MKVTYIEQHPGLLVVGFGRVGLDGLGQFRRDGARPRGRGHHGEGSEGVDAVPKIQSNLERVKNLQNSKATQLQSSLI